MIGEEAVSERRTASASSDATSVREAVVQAAGVLGAELERRAERAPIDDEIGELLAVDELDRAFRESAARAAGSARDGSGLVTATVRSLDGRVELSIQPDLFARARPAQLSAALTEALSNAIVAYQRSALERARDAKPEGLLGRLCSNALVASEGRVAFAQASASSACAGEPAVAEPDGPEWGAPERGPAVPGEERDRESMGPAEPGGTGEPGAALGGAVPW